MENNNQISKQIDDLTELVVFIKDNGATKDDLKQFATKDDLKQFATKDDLDALEGKLKTTMVSKAYLDDKLADLSSELGDRIYRKNELDKAFKKEVVIIFKKHSLCNTEELERLNELI